MMSKKEERQNFSQGFMLTMRSENPGLVAAVPEESSYGVSGSEKRILCTIMPEQPLLPFPLRELRMRQGPPAQEYQIPESERERVLRETYPFSPCPQMDERRFDLHENCLFAVRDYKLIRERNRNFLVSPYYANSGGMVIDWMDEGKFEQQLHLIRAVHDQG